MKDGADNTTSIPSDDNKEIIDRNLIIENLKNGNIDVASSMLNTITKPLTQPKGNLQKKKIQLTNEQENFLKDVMITLIESFPKIKENSKSSLDEAIKTMNGIKDKYKNIRNKLSSDPAISDIIKTLKPILGLPSEIKEDLRNRAIEQLCYITTTDAGYKTEQDEMAAAKLIYDTKLQDSSRITSGAKAIIESIVNSNVNLEKFNIASTMSVKLKDVDMSIRDEIFKGLDINKEINKSSPTALPKSFAKTVNYLAGGSTELSAETESSMANYKDALNKATLQDKLSSETLNRNLSQRKSPEGENEDQRAEAELLIMKQHASNPEQLKAVELIKNKDELFKVAITRINLDLVPKAIKLYQFNNILDQNLRCDPNKLKQSLESSLIYHVTRLDPNVKKESTLGIGIKGNFLTLLNNSVNKSEYEEKNIPLDQEEIKNQMKITLESLGIKSELLLENLLSATGPKTNDPTKVNHQLNTKTPDISFGVDEVYNNGKDENISASNPSLTPTPNKTITSSILNQNNHLNPLAHRQNNLTPSGATTKENNINRSSSPIKKADIIDKSIEEISKRYFSNDKTPSLHNVVENSEASQNNSLTNSSSSPLENTEIKKNRFANAKLVKSNSNTEAREHDVSNSILGGVAASGVPQKKPNRFAGATNQEK